MHAVPDRSLHNMKEKYLDSSSTIRLQLVAHPFADFHEMRNSHLK